MADIVQTRKTPPILIPLDSPERAPLARIHKRIKLIHDYAERHRELHVSEASELLTLKYLVAHGRLPPQGRVTIDLEAIRKDLLA